MEEIEFRVLDKRLGKIFPVIRLCKDFVGDCEEPYVYYLNNRNELEWLPLSEGVLMQYTGSKDKNNQKIYEGDYLSISGYDYEEPYDDWEGIVTMGHFGWGILGYNSNGDKAFYYLNEIGGNYITTYEVLGNIYENTELLGSD